MEIETKTTTERTERGCTTSDGSTSDGSSSFVVAALIGVLVFLACNEHGRRAHFTPYPRVHVTERR
ncbi:MAG: hypothetical protein EPO08_21110 [Rhodospirillaceae bacterium]|nr:MAG: hypothetical protein EPO08_21110 [Rhodospirillaceae bacterium]